MLTSKQRAMLRSMASTMDTIMQIGKSGIYDSLDVGAIWLDQCIKENPLSL